MDDTELYRVGKEHEKWLIDLGTISINCWNFSDDEALRYITDLISTSITENGVTYYRQDQNIWLHVFFDKADKDYYNNRQGFCENHYITNKYKFLDTLKAENPGLMIDNCASGGRRLDLEMARRSIPIWRSNYNCDPHDDLHEATQSQTLGLSCWLPMSGTMSYLGNKYEAMTSIVPCQVDTFNSAKSPWFNTFTNLRYNKTENFYPLQCGGYDVDKYLAMQYSSFDANEGFAVVYKREMITDNSTVLKLNGLEENVTYVVKDFLSDSVLTEVTGLQLMENGVSVNLPENPDAAVITFAVKK